MRRLTLLAAALALAIGPALAQDYSTRPITVIVPFPAGGPTDTIARVDRWGPIIKAAAEYAD